MVMEKCSGRPSPCLSTGKQGTKKQTATEQGQVFCQHVTVLCPGTLQSQAGDVRGTVGRSHEGEVGWYTNKCLLASLNGPVGNGLSGIHAEASLRPELV